MGDKRGTNKQRKNSEPREEEVREQEHRNVSRVRRRSQDHQGLSQQPQGWSSDPVLTYLTRREAHSLMRGWRGERDGSSTRDG